MAHDKKNLSVEPCGATYTTGLQGHLHRAELITNDAPAVVEAADYLLASYDRLPVGTFIDAVMSAGGVPVAKQYVVRTSSSASVKIAMAESEPAAGVGNLFAQGAPAAKTVSATLTAAELLAGIITGNQAGAGAAAYTLPLAADLDTALPGAAANDAFDFFVINLSTVGAEDITMTTNTGWTLVGSMLVIEQAAGNPAGSNGHFRARKTAAGAWTLYRIA